MPQYTKNLNLTKLQDNDYYDGNIENDNLDKIDKALHNKVDKVKGKGLSSNDLTDELVKTINNKAGALDLNSHINNSAIHVSAETLNRINELFSRMARVEDGLFNNITGNPFNRLFNSVEGIQVVTGVWNKKKQRIEC